MLVMYKRLAECSRLAEPQDMSLDNDTDKKHGRPEGACVSDRRQLPNWSHDKPDDICHPREAGRRSSRSLAGGSQAYRYATTLRF